METQSKTPLKKINQMPSHRQRGFALVLILMTLVLLTVTIVAYFSRVTGDLRQARAYSQSVESKTLADSAINLVTAQLRDATAGFQRDSVGELDPNERLAWASQPGMIRTWDQNGDPYRFYKLYSDSDLQITTSHLSGLQDDRDEASAWSSFDRNNDGTPDSSYDALWVDLNAPDYRADNTLAYPIVTPPSTLDPDNGVKIDDPTTTEQDGVAGFNIVTPPGFSGSNPTPLNNPAPMPVQWLYILSDGTIAPASAATTTSSGTSVVDLPLASSDNPPVGRIAFWTDDETSKLNLNTASEGTYWSPPMAGGPDESIFAISPPAKGEFQRVIGHPATVSLSAALYEFAPGPQYDTDGVVETDYIQGLQEIFGFTPRYAFGGSEGGSWPFDDKFAAISFDQQQVPTVMSGFGPINLPSNRLYASLDEFFFEPDRELQSNYDDQDSKDAEALSDREFFLTASSRAPETNIFNMPRISLWPVTWPWDQSRHALARKTPKVRPFTTKDPTDPLSDNTWMTLSERLIAFCTTVGSDFRYFFQRQSPDDPYHDFNQIERNQELLSWLKNLTELNVPGFGDTIRSRYATDAKRDSMLVTLFDFIRGAVNLATMADTDPTTNEIETYSFAGFGLRPAYINDPVILAQTKGGNRMLDVNRATVFPIRIDLGAGEQIGLGSGATPVITQVSLLFYATDRRDPIRNGHGPDGNMVPPNWLSMAGIPPDNPMFDPGAEFDKKQEWLLGPDNMPNTPDDRFNPSNLITAKIDDVDVDGFDKQFSGKSQTTEMQMVMLVETRIPSNNRIAQPEYWLKVSGAPFKVNGTSIGFPTAGNSAVKVFPVNDTVGTLPDLQYLLYAKNSPKAMPHNPQDSRPSRNWTLASMPIAVDPESPTFTFDGSEVTMEILPTDPNDPDEVPDSSLLYQTVLLDFTKLDNTYPIPLAPRWLTGKFNVENNSNDWRIRDQKDLDETTEISQTPNWTKAGTHLLDPWGVDEDDLVLETAPVNARYLYLDESPETSKEGEVSTKWESNAGRGLLLTSFANGATGYSSAVDTGYYPGWTSQAKSSSVITPYDVVMTLIVDPTKGAQSDLRVLAQLSQVPSSYYVNINDVFAPTFMTRCPGVPLNCSTHQAQNHIIGWGEGGSNQPFSGAARNVQFTLLGAARSQRFQIGEAEKDEIDPILVENQPVMAELGSGSAWKKYGSLGEVGYVGVTAPFLMDAGSNGPGDWATSYGNFPDGGKIILPEQHFQVVHADPGNADDAQAKIPFFNTFYDTVGDPATVGDYFSPNRQIASGVMFGSLPDASGIGWQTLNFSPVPNPKAGSPSYWNLNHPGLTSNPPDHIWLDLFTMPIVEPYAISEPLSTAGKINLNFQIEPFAHIDRSTALHGLLKPVQIGAIEFNTNTQRIYKSDYFMKQAKQQTRFDVDTYETVERIRQKFTDDLYVTASQICEIPLVPEGFTHDDASLQLFWGNKQLTSDTSREAPYNHLYPLLTTKSNTYRVHFIVQSLEPNRVWRQTDADYQKWDELRDQVVGEYRGSALLERYVDPSDPNLPDFATLDLSDPDDLKSSVIDQYYRFRVLENKQFQP